MALRKKRTRQGWQMRGWLTVFQTRRSCQSHQIASQIHQISCQNHQIKIHQIKTHQNSSKFVIEIHQKFIKCPQISHSSTIQNSKWSNPSKMIDNHSIYAPAYVRAQQTLPPTSAAPEAHKSRKIIFKKSPRVCRGELENPAWKNERISKSTLRLRIHTATKT